MRQDAEGRLFSRRVLSVTLTSLVLIACPEPRITFEVSLPDGLDRRELTLDLSVYLPADDSVDCDAIAYGDVALPALVASRLAFSRLMDQGVVAKSSTSTAVPRSGRKIAVVIGAWGGQKTDLDFTHAVVAACHLFDDVDGDSVMRIEAQPTTQASILVDDELFLSAQMGAGPGLIRIQTQIRDSDGTLRDAHPSAGLPLALTDSLGQVSRVPVRATVSDWQGRTRYSVKIDVSDDPVVELFTDRLGPFVISLRVPFQRGSVEDLRGLAYRVLLDSDEDSTLRPVLGAGSDRILWAQLATLGDLATAPVTNLFLARLRDGGQQEVLQVPLVVGAPLTSSVALSVRRSSPIVGVGALQWDNGSSLRGGYLLWVPGSVGANLLPAVHLMRAAGAAIEQSTLPGFQAVSGLAEVGLCGQRQPRYLIGFRNGSDPRSNSPLSRYALFKINTQIEVLDYFSDDVASEVYLINPPPRQLHGGLCLQDAEGETRRILATWVLNMSTVSILTFFADDPWDDLLAARDKVLRNWVLGNINAHTNLETALEQTRLLVPTFHNADYEANAYALVNVDDRPQAKYMETWQRTTTRGRALFTRVKMGRLLAESANPGLVSMILRTNGQRRAVADLYFSPEPQSRTEVFKLPIPLALGRCNTHDQQYCGQADVNDLHLADLDGDGVQEVLYMTLYGDPLRVRLRVIGFENAPW